MLERELPPLHTMRADLALLSRPRAAAVALPLFLLCVIGASTARAQAASESGVSSSMAAAGDAAPKGSAPKGAAPKQKRRSPSSKGGPSRTPVHSARVAAMVGPAWSSPRTVTELAGDLGSVLHANTRGGEWGVLVVSLTRGDTLYSENPDELLKPASTMKLMTTALALEKFGPDHTFQTQVLAGGVSGGVADNLYL